MDNENEKDLEQTNGQPEGLNVEGLDMTDHDKIIPVKIDEEMRKSYIDYSMSVIVSRALPDVRDGFKPVQRRVLFGMNELGVSSDKPTKKSARIVGDVMGKYHPHGDSSIYGTLVRLAQPWNMRYCLVDGQGNFGNVDGDGAAAMRYTEARLSKLAEEMLRDIEKDTVDMVPNFDDSLREPAVLPCRFPNLLVNGGTGIAVGMATNMATHNLGEVIDGCVAFVNNRKARIADANVEEITVEDLMEYVKAPDFPTGGTIYGYQGVKDAFETGRGRIVIRSNADIETDANGREKIVVTELPYGVVKSDLVKKIGDLVSDKKIEGISDISDLSTRDIRIVIEVKRDANAQVVLNKLYKFTELQSSFSVNNIALVHGRPMLLNLKDLIGNFVDHRMDVVTRRTRYELRKAEERAHILEGLIIAVDNIDEVIRIIKASRTPQDAQTNLEARFNLDNLQSKAIVDMRLSALTGLRIDELKNEYQELEKLIAHLNELLANEVMRYDVINDELEEVKAKYADERRTQIVKMATEFNPEDMYADDDMVITISHLGYIKRTPLTEFRQQSRGGIGSKAGSARDTDFIEKVYQASMHSTMMFFTEMGRLYWLKVYELPEGTLTDGQSEMLVASYNGKVVRFNEGGVRPMGRSASGVKAITLENDGEDRVIGTLCVEKGTDKTILVISENGFGKRTPVDDENGEPIYRITNRGGKGVKTIEITEKTGHLVGIEAVTDEDDLMLMTKSGTAIRMDISTIRQTGRAAQGVKLIELQKRNDSLVSGCIVPKEEESENGENVENGENGETNNENNE